MSTLTLSGIRSAARRRLSGWILERVRRRRAPSPLPLELEHRSIFVVPTPFGWAFGLLLVFMALGGLNFNNNLALMLVFLLAVIAQLTTMMAYRNLKGLRVESVRSEPVFAGETARFEVHVSNPEARNRFALISGPAIGAASDCIDLGLEATGVLAVTREAEARGWLPMPTLRLETRYPIGLFQAWSWVFAQARCMVYPQPAANPPPLPQLGHGHAGRPRRGEGDQVHGLRKYRAGDSLRRVAWRTSARHDDLYSREMEVPQEKSCVLAWDELTDADPEHRLSVLTAWVLKADHRRIAYALELPETRIAPGRGPEHRARCLEALALCGL